MYKKILFPSQDGTMNSFDQKFFLFLVDEEKKRGRLAGLGWVGRAMGVVGLFTSADAKV